VVRKTRIEKRTIIIKDNFKINPASEFFFGRIIASSYRKLPITVSILINDVNIASKP
jgi:hypothetical protein